LTSKRNFSPATQLLRSKGFQTAQVARVAERHPNALSQILSGSKPWTEWFNLSLIEVTNDRELVADMRGLANESRRDYLKRELAKFEASL
jgi:hypothetical protein